jgi:hypothetical protein
MTARPSSRKTIVRSDKVGQFGLCNELLCRGRAIYRDWETDVQFYSEGSCALDHDVDRLIAALAIALQDAQSI